MKKLKSGTDIKLTEKEIKDLFRIMFNNYMSENGVMRKTILRKYKGKKKEVNYEQKRSINF